MGQYHHPVCIEAEEALVPHSMGLLLKEAEQGWSRPGTPSAMVALVCARGGNMPADFSQSPLIGRWAGKRVLVQGDYAEDTDISGWDGPPLSMLYSAVATEDDRREALIHHEKSVREYKAKGQEYPYPAPDYSTVPFLKDISREACDFFEGACNVRYFTQTQHMKDGRTGKIVDTWTSTHSVQVRALAREFGGSGVAEYVIDPSYEASDLEYLKRCGLDPKDVMRPPRSGDWHGFLDSEIAEGNARVLVNLDTLEYINPLAFGQAPTLAGMVRKAPKDRALPALKQAAKDGLPIDVAGGLFAMLCHHERRGGGDLPANATDMSSIDKERAKYARMFKGAEDVKGRWRGGHIYGTLERHVEIDGVEYPSTEEVIEKGIDISGKVLKYLVAVSHY